MPSYAVMICGKNFPSRVSEGAKGPMGFYTTRFVEAIDAREAELATIDLVRVELLPLLGNRREGEANPTLDLDEIREIATLPVGAPGAGATWFPMDS